MKFRKFFIIIAAVALSVAALGLYESSTEPQIEFEAPPIVQNENQEGGVVPVVIRVPELNVHVPLEMGSITNDEWLLSEDVANYLDVSGRIGEEGNIVVYGHDKKDIFGNLTKAEVGQTILLTGSDGRERAYVIERVFETTPENVDVIQPTEDETLTVYTCTGWRASERLIVQAKPAV